MEDQNQPKISMPEIILLVMFALLADALNWIPIINIFVSAVSSMSFQLYFFMKGVKKAKYSLVGNLLEFIPFLSILPAVTAGVVATIISERLSETKLGSLTSKSTGNKRIGDKRLKGDRDFRGERERALHELSGKNREIELGRIRKQESGELSGRALYSRKARIEEKEQDKIKKEAEKRAERKYRPGYEPEALAKEERERQKIEEQEMGRR
jgi:hypothetical protein